MGTHRWSRCQGRKPQRRRIEHVRDSFIRLRTIRGSVVLEHTWCESELAVVVQFASGFNTECCEPKPAVVLVGAELQCIFVDAGWQQLSELLAEEVVRQVVNSISKLITTRNPIGLEQ